MSKRHEAEHPAPDRLGVCALARVLQRGGGVKTTSVRDPGELRTSEAWKPDLISGFLVFLIALPLCLGISMASGFPPFAGVLTAIVGGLVTTFLGSAPLTIKGPAAGLIVIVLGAVDELGQGDPMRGYRLALAAVVMSGLIQAGFGLMKAGRFGDFFPSSAVHGMLAAIGVIIASKQIHVALGVSPEAKTPIGLLLEIPKSVAHANPGIALIGLSSLAILFTWPLFRKTRLGFLPAPLVVLLVAMPLGLALDLDHQHQVHWGAMFFDLGPKFLIRVPERLSEMVNFPDFSAVSTGGFWKHVALFSLIGGLESLLSAKAIDTLDPWGRKSDLNRDLIALGVGNAVSGLLGGLPMISEIVRSSANVNNGARTRMANFFHAAFLFAFIALVPGLVHEIPLAALAAMLVYTGTRLASPKAFAEAWSVGTEQFAVFTTTVVVTLMTDLLVGIGAGILLKLAIHVARGVRPGWLFSPRVEVEHQERVTVVRVGRAAVFSNYLGIKRLLASVPLTQQLVVDLSETVLVDHTVMHHLKHEESERLRSGGQLELVGLDGHQSVSGHPLAARIRRLAQNERGALTRS